MNKTLLLTLVGLVCSCQLFAQQLPLLSQLQESAGVLNPAALPGQYFLNEHNVSFTGTHHDQWTGIEGAPQTSQLAGTFILDDYSPIVPVVGGYFINDQTGPTGFTGLYGKFGGIISDDPYYRGIVAAFQFGINQYRLNLSELELRDQETVLASNDDGRISPDAGLGLFAYQRFRENIVYLGFSAPQVLGLDLMFRGNDGEIVTQRYRHYYGQVGGIFKLTGDSFLEPSAWVKYVPNLPVNVTATLRYQTPTPLFIGFGGSSASSIHGEAGVSLGDRSGYGGLFRVGYGFDYGFNSYGPYAGSTHEINLTYSFNR